jgi:acyl-CoA hydrolase
MALNIVNEKEAINLIKSGDRVFIQGAAMTPIHLVESMCQAADRLRDVEVIHLHTEGNAPYADEKFSNSFKLNSCFVAGNVRKSINSGIGDYVPIFLSEVHLLFERNIMPIDVALLQVSPPDKHGFCSLGTSIDASMAAMRSAKKVIAQVNQKVPRSHGDGVIHINQIDAAVEYNTPLHESIAHESTETEIKIGKNVAELIEDGACLQMGIGGIPNVVLKQLTNHKNLGIHTEMFSDGILPLVESGVINGSKKYLKTGKIVSCFAMGSQKLFDFIDDNPIVHLKEAAYTNRTHLIAMNPKVTAINSAIEIDFTGQVCADTIGHYQYSGVGGQMDFIRGASLSEGGKAIIAMPSTTKNGDSKIVPYLKEGAGVTTTRAHVHYIATEYGVVNLFGMNLRQRAKALISIAHPNHRENLDKGAFERFKPS